MDAVTTEPPFRWQSVALPVFLPTILFSTGEGAIIPIIPIVADDRGAGLAVAGLIAAMITVGHLVGDLPSGWLVARFGERASMIGASAVALAGLVLASLSHSPWLLGVGILLVGLATAVFALARHAYMTSSVPLAYRARALSTLGGTFRLGYFIGPFLAAAVIHLSGSASAVFAVHIVGCLGAAVVLLLLRDPASTGRSSNSRGSGVRRGGIGAHGGSGVAPEAGASAPAPKGLFRTLGDNRPVLLRLGTGAGLVSAIRASRAVVLPLWAVSIGIGDSSTALIIGIAGAVDFALFYASGQIMDRFGRLWSALPSTVGLGLGHLALAVSHDWSWSTAWFVGVAMALSVANGLGAGILMTLGADLADRRDPAAFLGAWRFTTDLGGASAPLLIAGVTAVASLPVAAGVMGVLALAGAGVLLRYVPRYAPRHRPPE
jgi:MFS family permease